MSEHASTPQSPCIDVCRMNERTGWCEGCFRTIDEIATWSTLTDAEKRKVWSMLIDRSALDTGAGERLAPPAQRP